MAAITLDKVGCIMNLLKVGIMIGNIGVFYIVTVGANAVINNRFKQQNHILKLKKLNSRSYGKFVDYSAFLHLKRIRQHAGHLPFTL